MCFCDSAILCIQCLNNIGVQQIPDTSGNAVPSLEIIALNISLNVVADSIFHATNDFGNQVRRKGNDVRVHTAPSQEFMTKL